MAGRQTCNWAALVGTLFIVLIAVPAEAGDADVTVTQREKLVSVVGSIHIQAAAPCVLSVITDYGRLASFIPQLQESQIVESHGDTAVVVEQTSVSKFWFQKRVSRARFLAIRSGNTVRTEFLEGDFHHHETEWTLENHEEGTILGYRATIRSVHNAPGWIVRRMVKGSVGETLEAIREETAGRVGRKESCPEDG